MPLSKHRHRCPGRSVVGQAISDGKPCASLV